MTETGTDPSLLVMLWQTLRSTVINVLPIVAVLGLFQALVLRRPVPRLGHVLVGMVYVILGLTLFLVGLQEALFPLGEAMARQLTAPAFLGVDPATAADIHWADYMWVYAFAAAIGFATIMAEPALIAVGLKAQEVSGGSLRANGLRLAVAVGGAIGVTLGTWRIVTGVPLHWVIMVGYGLLILQTLVAPRNIIPLAYDSGGVTTSTVTVPVVTALGLGLARTLPGRDPVVDGFGVIALTVLFPMVTVMAYARLAPMMALILERLRPERRDEVQTDHRPDHS